MRTKAKIITGDETWDRHFEPINDMEASGLDGAKKNSRVDRLLGNLCSQYFGTLEGQYLSITQGVATSDR